MFWLVGKQMEQDSLASNRKRFYKDFLRRAMLVLLASAWLLRSSSDFLPQDWLEVWMNVSAGRYLSLCVARRGTMESWAWLGFSPSTSPFLAMTARPHRRFGGVWRKGRPQQIDDFKKLLVSGIPQMSALWYKTLHVFIICQGTTDRHNF